MTARFLLIYKFFKKKDKEEGNRTSQITVNLSSAGDLELHVQWIDIYRAVNLKRCKQIVKVTSVVGNIDNIDWQELHWYT